MSELDAGQVAARLDEITRIIESIVEDRGLLAQTETEARKRFLIAAGQVSHPDKTARRQLDYAKRKHARKVKREEDQALLDQTGIRKLRSNPIFQTPRRRSKAARSPEPIGEVNTARTCYVCREKFTDVHHFYDAMCRTCGDFNHDKRSQTTDMSGRVAMVTGARVKIGYQTAILLLRAGAHVVATTRFPVDAARRYAAEADFDAWSDRLEIHGIDLRQIPAVEALCEQLNSTLPRLDFIVNNACQTVRRPPGFYDHLMTGERGLQLPAEVTGLLAPAAKAELASWSAELTQIPLVSGDETRGEMLFPTGKLDADLQQVDLRDVNSWRLEMADVPTVELLEVQLVNAVAPYLINARLKGLMMRVKTSDTHIVNASAMEGQFYRTFKSARHPHTNMAKAALNMMTRTAALDYIEHGIHMNSVDTGWVTDEDPAHHAELKRENHNFHPPLDIVDGAARLVDPMFAGLNTGEQVWGQFLKDYRPTDW
jgi:NAD(P)-dependent dehydrogenase (short-subunit alcohol dehydrogenase family)